MTDNDAVNNDLAKIREAEFIAFNPDFFRIMGTKATCEKIFDVPTAVHEAPVWLPDTNTIIFSPQNQSYQLVIDLNSDPVCPPLNGLTVANHEQYHCQPSRGFN